MAKALEVKRIDLLVHPFYEDLFSSKQPYSKREARLLLKVYKKQIDEAAADPSRLLFIASQDRFDSLPKKGTLAQVKKELYQKILDYATKRMGERLGFYIEGVSNTRKIKDSSGQEFSTFNRFSKVNGFQIDRRAVKTRGFGEYTLHCVFEELSRLNATIGMRKRIPYKNPQSAIMLRKSVGHEFTPWGIQKHLRTTVGKRILRRKAKTYIERKRERVRV